MSTRRSWLERGLAFAKLAEANAKIFGYRATLRMGLAKLLEQPPRDRFDERFGVSTVDVMSKVDAKLPPERLNQATLYMPTHPQVLRHVLEHLGPDHERWVIADLGCGKGRVLMAAMEYPFKRIEGVELSPVTSAIARENLRTFAATNSAVRCRDVTVHCQDLLDFVVRDAPVVYYVYDAFFEPIWEQLLTRIHEAATETGHPTRIVYCAPYREGILRRSGRFQRIKAHRVFSIEYSWSMWAPI